MPVNKALLDILCCPASNGGEVCHGDFVDLENALQCKSCGLLYPIEDGIPVLLVGSARRGTLPHDGVEAVATH
jgi:uncharacterized protein YbaR (Trm112 family)